jgi:DNA-binding NarL/FixJ family response regulator
VLVLTHLEEKGLYERFLEAGANEVLPKTIHLEEIFAAVRRLGGGEGRCERRSFTRTATAPTARPW